MTENYGLPQALTGCETVTIHQVQNGQVSVYTMPISELLTYVNASAPAWWVASLPTTLPSKTGVLWNNTGMLSIS